MATKTYKINIDVDTKTLGQLEDELSQINNELKQVDRNSAAFTELASKSKVLTAEIEKTNNAIDGIQLEDKLQAADGAIKVLGGSLSAVVGTLGVLGVESEVFGKFEEKAASAIAVGMGIKDVSEGFGQFAVVMKKSGIAAKLFGTTTKKALIATGVGIFIVVLGTVVAYWDDITKAVTKFANAVPFVGKAIDAIKGAFDALFEAARPVLEFLGLIPDEAERAAMAVVESTTIIINEGERELALAQAKKASAQELFEIRERLAKAEIERLIADNAEKDEIFKAETELLSLQIAEQTRIKDEAAAAEEERRQMAFEARQLEIDGFEETAERIQAQLEPIGLQSLKVASASDQLADSVKSIVPALTAADAATFKYNQAQKTQEYQAQANRDGLAATGQALGNLGAVLDQESTAAKALAISSAIINTYLGVTEALKQPSVLPSPFDIITKVANIATIVASGFKAVQAIKSTPKKSGGGAPANIGGGRRGAASTASAPQRIPDVAQTFGEDATAPAIKAYVVGGDVRSEQEAEAKINSRRTIA